MSIYENEKSTDAKIQNIADAKTQHKLSIATEALSYHAAHPDAPLQRKKIISREGKKILNFCFSKLLSSSRKSTPAYAFNSRRFIDDKKTINDDKYRKIENEKKEYWRIAEKFGRKYGTWTVCRAEDKKTALHTHTAPSTMKAQARKKARDFQKRYERG